MAVKESPRTFTAHGRDFPSKAAAERFDKLEAARQDLEAAEHKYEQLLAENAITADGEAFKFGVFADYWRITNPIYSMPQIVKLEYMCRDWRVRDRERADGKHEIEIRHYSWKEKDQPFVPISELYADRDKAEAAHFAAQRAWLAERSAEVDKYEAKSAAKK